MKKSGLFAAASAAAAASASATAISASSHNSTLTCNHNIPISHQEASSGKDQERPSASADKFAPRFDGLRFIETLVTGHR